MADESGHWPQWLKSVANIVKNAAKSIIRSAISRAAKKASKAVKAIKDAGIVRYDVPLYRQGNLSICWAYCQTMVESYQSKTTLAQEQADKRAKEIAVLVNGKNKWNRGALPTNIADTVEIKGMFSLVKELKKDLYMHIIKETAESIWLL